MMGKRTLPAFVFAAAAIAGCHGAKIPEADGGGAAGGITVAGAAGAGGSATGAGGGTGCTAQLQPVMFHETTGTPVSSQGTSNRYYWVESGSTNITVHYSPGAAPASDNAHPLQFDENTANTYCVDASDAVVAATWAVEGQVAVYGPDKTSTQMGPTLTLGTPSCVAVDGATVFFSWFPTSAGDTKGIYTWNPSAAPAVFESYAALGGDFTYGKLIRVTPTKLLLSDLTDVWVVDRGAKGVAIPLFENPATNKVLDVRPARPHSIEQGVLVDLADATFSASGRDYYVDFTQPGTSVDLATQTNALADSSACGAAAHYKGAGVLYQRRYVYEGQGGLFAVDVSSVGAVSNLVRLTTQPLGRPEVTGAGDLFAIASTSGGTKWAYYRVGNL